MAYNLINILSSELVQRKSLLDGNKTCHLGEPINDHPNFVTAIRCFGQLKQDINSYVFSQPFKFEQGTS